MNQGGENESIAEVDKFKLLYFHDRFCVKSWKLHNAFSTFGSSDGYGSESFI